VAGINGPWRASGGLCGAARTSGAGVVSEGDEGFTAEDAEIAEEEGRRKPRKCKRSL